MPRAQRLVRGGCLAILALAAGLVGAPGDAVAAVRTPSLTRAEALRRQGCQAVAQDRADGVDRLYEAAVEAYGVLALRGDAAPDTPAGREAIRLYNDSLGMCLQAASAFGRIDPRSHLVIAPQGRRGVVPIVHLGFVWSPEDVSMLVDPATIRPMREIKTRHARPGVGAVEVAQRVDLNRTTPFLARAHPFAATAVLHPDLAAWFGGPVPEVGGDRLELIDPWRVDRVAIGPHTVRLAADFDAPMAQLRASTGGERLGYLGFLRPGNFEEGQGLYVFEPYQPGKIPVVLVHGLLSSPVGFAQMINDLRADPRIEGRYQFWVYAYPTGNNFLRSARGLRAGLDRAVATFDPGGVDPAMRQMVLLGYSMGGLIVKAQVTFSGEHVWDTVAARPLETLNVGPAQRAMISEIVHFEPRPYVRRVIYMVTPHRGSTLANALVGRLGDSLVRLPDDTEVFYREIRRDNPGVFRPGFERPVSSIDLLEAEHPLLMTLDRLPRSSLVAAHSVIGLHSGWGLQPPGDDVVPVTSARVSGVASERFIDEVHTGMSQNPAAIEEVRRVLLEHAAQVPAVAARDLAPQRLRFASEGEGEGAPR